jgi:hypothetical protein
MVLSKKAIGDASFHVASLLPRTIEQALDERRLLLELDHRGTVTAVMSSTPIGLFGFDAAKLLNKHICHFVPLMRLGGTCDRR